MTPLQDQRSVARIEALGCHVPSTVVTTRDLLAERPLLGALVEGATGVRARRTGGDSYDMAVRAVADCFSRSRYTAADLDLVVCCSITRTKEKRLYFEPSFASMIAHEFGAGEALCFDVSNACAGVMTGILLVDRMIRRGLARCGLVLGAEQATLVSTTAVREIVNARDPQTASLTLGDSAVAVLVDRAVDERDRIHDVRLLTAARFALACLVMPSDKSQGLAMYTDTRSQQSEPAMEVWPTFLAEHVPSFQAEQFDVIIHHQVSARVVEQLNAVGARILRTPMPRSPTVLETYGNTATTSHFLVLHEQLARHRIAPGSKLLLVPNASGLVTGFMSVTVTSPSTAPVR
ncbi:3-oxoacyl-ACP synthase III family protein [Streptomyces sp. NPDC002536]